MYPHYTSEVVVGGVNRIPLLGLGVFRDFFRMGEWTVVLLTTYSFL